MRVTKCVTAASYNGRIKQVITYQCLKIVTDWVEENECNEPEMEESRMKDLIEFIDSPDIREYNRETKFVPAEWAVLIRASEKRTIEEKMEALQYLVDHYEESDFGDERVNIHGPVYPPYDEEMPMREVVKRTLALWRDILDDREKNENVVYVASFGEVGYVGSSWSDDQFFSNYGDAYACLSHKKQEYLEDEELKDIETVAEICRIRMGGGGDDKYFFDSQMRLVDLEEDLDRVKEESGDLFCPLRTLVYQIHVPLPFQKGDIVKVKYWGDEPYYGVISCDWKLPEKREWINMWISLDLYDSDSNEFDYTDGTGDCVLQYTLCPDEELPKEERVLKLIRAVHQGKLDWYTLLHKYGRKELDQVLEWDL